MVVAKVGTMREVKHVLPDGSVVRQIVQPQEVHILAVGELPSDSANGTIVYYGGSFHKRVGGAWKDHEAETNTAHGATASPTASTLVARDSDGWSGLQGLHLRPSVGSVRVLYAFLQQPTNDYGYKAYIDTVSTGKMFVAGWNAGSEVDMVVLDRGGDISFLVPVVVTRSSGVTLTLNQTGGWPHSALTVNGYSYLGGFRINGADGANSVYAGGFSYGFTCDSAYTITMGIVWDTPCVHISSAGLKLDKNLGFFGGTPAAKQTVTGSKGGNAALDSLIDALVAYGLITDTTT